MAHALSESATVARVDGGLIEIVHKQPWSDGTELGGDLVLDAANAAALADMIDAAGPMKELDVPPDVFLVKFGGDDREPLILIQNHRAPSAPRGKTYSVGMGEATARSVATQLRSV